MTHSGGYENKTQKNLEQKIVTKIDISNEKEETISLM